MLEAPPRGVTLIRCVCCLLQCGLLFSRLLLLCVLLSTALLLLEHLKVTIVTISLCSVAELAMGQCSCSAAALTGELATDNESATAAASPGTQPLDAPLYHCSCPVRLRTFELRQITQLTADVARKLSREGPH
jgi:hypothetical protein